MPPAKILTLLSRKTLFVSIPVDGLAADKTKKADFVFC